MQELLLWEVFTDAGLQDAFGHQDTSICRVDNQTWENGDGRH